MALSKFSVSKVLLVSVLLSLVIFCLSWAQIFSVLSLNKTIGTEAPFGGKEEFPRKNLAHVYALHVSGVLTLITGIASCGYALPVILYLITTLINSIYGAVMVSIWLRLKNSLGPDAFKELFVSKPYVDVGAKDEYPKFRLYFSMLVATTLLAMVSLLIQFFTLATNRTTLKLRKNKTADSEGLSQTEMNPQSQAYGMGERYQSSTH